MPKAYWVVAYRSISDPAALAAYAKISLPAIEAGGGKILARSIPAKTFENGMNERIVVVEFPASLPPSPPTKATPTKSPCVSSATPPIATSAS